METGEIVGYVNIDSKAKQWDVSSRYVQSLCSQGRIAGAIKKGGKWAIPAEAENPSKGRGKSDRYLFFTGTKRKIFLKSAEFFALQSYDVVGVKMIADAVGIRQSALYNHFQSKQEILDTLYDFFEHYFTADRPTIESLENILRRGSLADIMRSMNYEFSPEYNDLMLTITQIIIRRAMIDFRAKDLCSRILLEDGIYYDELVLSRAVEIGRLEPFDVHSVAVYNNSMRFHIFYRWSMEPNGEHYKYLVAEHERINDFFFDNIVDKGVLD